MGYAKNSKIDRRSSSEGKGKRSTERVPYTDFRYVRIELNEKEKQQLRDLVASGEFESLSVDDFLGDGYSVSYSSGDSEKTVVCTASMYKPDHHNAGLRLSGRGADAIAALTALAFKHVYLCADTLWREAEDSRGGSYSDYG